MTNIKIALTVLGFVGLATLSLHMEAAAADNTRRIQGQLETTVIQVDKYGVYVPNIVFYWDTDKGKEALATLTSAANKLRNKKVIVTYSAIDNLEKDKRPLLVDIAPVREETQPDKGNYRETTPSGELPQEHVSENGRSADEEKRLPNKHDEDLVTYTNEQDAILPTLQSAPITKEEVIAFIEYCVNANATKNMEAVLSCYADQVDYYSKGLVDKNFVRKDKGFYFRNWDRINSIVDDIIMIVTDQQDVRIAKFSSYFTVENEKQTVTGDAENIWKIRKINNHLRIISEKQKIISEQVQ